MTLTAVRRVPPLPSIQELIRVYKLGAIKRLSQNFLLHQPTIRKLVRCAGDLTDAYVCEVGPGPGGITREILNANIRGLSVIEKDARFIPVLRSLAYAYEPTNKTLKIYQGDVLKFNMKEALNAGEAEDWYGASPKLHIIGNLPFNVSTPLITRWLCNISEQDGAWSYGRTKLTLTFQKEVGERMVADVAGNQRSRLSIMCQYLCDVKLKYIIRGKAFVPAPDVDVAVVKFTPRKQPLINQPYHLVDKVVKHTFHYRQKYCRRGLSTLFPSELEHLTEDMLTKAGIDPTTRPTQISIDEFSRLCDLYSEYCYVYPGLFEYFYRDPGPHKVQGLIT